MLNASFVFIYIISVPNLQLAFLLTFSLAGCTKKQSSKEDTSPKDALEILTTVWSSYSDDNKFQAMGGDYNNMTDNKPGKFDVSDTESLRSLLIVPEDSAGLIDDSCNECEYIYGSCISSV